MARHSQADKDELVQDAEDELETSQSAPDFNWDVGDVGTAQYVADETGSLRDQVGHLSEDITGTHRKALGAALRERSNIKSRKSATELLTELADDRAFAWSAIAELLRVSVPALRKWRRSGGVSGPNRFRLNQLTAFCDFLAQNAIDDVAAWLDTPVMPGDFYVTPRWLYGRYENAPVALLEYAAQPGMDPHVLMDRLDPTIRKTAARVTHELVADSDGSISIHQR